MSKSSIVIVYSADPTKEVSIAGNFTDWLPEELTWNDSKSRYEYEVTRNDSSGKLCFKFIVNGDWIVDQNFASEFDDMGNENNVIIYDHTNEKEKEECSKRAVEHENENGPGTPDPTPLISSPPSITPVPETTPLEIPATTLSEGAKDNTPVISVTDREAILDSRPNPCITPVVSKTPEPLPTEDEIPGSLQKEPSSSITENAITPTGEPGENIPKNWTFFADILHLIAQFFRNWFARGAAA